MNVQIGRLPVNLHYQKTPPSQPKNVTLTANSQPMTHPTTESLRHKKCLPCEGGVPVIEHDAATKYLQSIPAWTLDNESKSIHRKVVCKHFRQAMKLLNQIAEVAEIEQHHPDLHLTGYRNVRIVLTTHAIGGLSENDFILAAKIDVLIDQH